MKSYRGDCARQILNPWFPIQLVSVNGASEFKLLVRNSEGDAVSKACYTHTDIIFVDALPKSPAFLSRGTLKADSANDL